MDFPEYLNQEQPQRMVGLASDGLRNFFGFPPNRIDAIFEGYVERAITGREMWDQVFDLVDAAALAMATCPRMLH